MWSASMSDNSCLKAFQPVCQPTPIPTVLDTNQITNRQHLVKERVENLSPGKIALGCENENDLPPIGEVSLTGIKPLHASNMRRQLRKLFAGCRVQWTEHYGFIDG